MCGLLYFLGHFVQVQRICNAQHIVNNISQTGFSRRENQIAKSSKIIIAIYKKRLKMRAPETSNWKFYAFVTRRLDLSRRV